VGGDGVPFCLALAKRERGEPVPYFSHGWSALSYLAPDITQAILDGGQPRDLTADKLLAHSLVCPLGWHEQGGPCSALPERDSEFIKTTASIGHCGSCWSARVCPAGLARANDGCSAFT